MDVPDIKLEYIPLMKRHINDAKNAQKEVTDEVEKTVQKFNSAAEAAARVSKATKTHYDHLRKMNDLSSASDRVKSDRALKINEDERQSELANKYAEKGNLEIESRNKLKQANGITVTTKEEDNQIQSGLNQNAAAAEAFLKGGGFWDEFKKQAAIKFGGASENLVASTEEQGTEGAKKRIKARDDYAEKVYGNDQLRKKKADLIADASKSSAAAAQIGLEIPGIVKDNGIAAAHEKSEANARLLASGGTGQASVSERERLGFRSGSGVTVSLLEVSKKQYAELQKHTKNLGEVVDGLRKLHY
jgi:hypothetical protein